MSSRSGDIEPRQTALCAALGAYPAATIYEALDKSGGMAPEIRPMLPNSRIAGVAFTIRTLGAETAAVLFAIADAPPGSVLVIDTGTSGAAPVWGGTSSLAAKARGLGGVVTNGVVRDLDEILKVGLPVYATGTCVRGTLKGHPGWRDVQVCVGGVVVNPGDYVVGDADGVVIVPSADAEQVLERAAAQRMKEEARDERIRRGEPLPVVVGLVR